MILLFSCSYYFLQKYGFSSTLANNFFTFKSQNVISSESLEERRFFYEES